MVAKTSTLYECKFPGALIVSAELHNDTARFGLITFPFYTGMIFGYIYSVVIGALKGGVEKGFLVDEEIKASRADSDEKQEHVKCVTSNAKNDIATPMAELKVESIMGIDKTEVASARAADNKKAERVTSDEAKVESVDEEQANEGSTGERSSSSVQNVPVTMKTGNS